MIETDFLVNKDFESTFYELGLSLSGISSKSEFHDWITSIPQKTTLRVNTLTTSSETLFSLLTEFLTQQYKEKEMTMPLIYCHETIPNVIVIDSSSVITQKTFEANFEAIVDIKCGGAVLRGSDVFVPGLIALSKDTTENSFVKVYANLEGRILKGSTPIGYKGKVKTLGVGRSLYYRHNVFWQLPSTPTNGIALQMLTSLPSLQTSFSEMFHLQNIPSIITSLALNPQSSDIVLDMCAAPGGKTVHLASLMNNEGLIIAFDKSTPKIMSIKKYCDLYGVKNVFPFLQDGVTALNKCLEINDGNTLDLRPGTFDKILVDAPCSALGQRPALKINMSLLILKSFPQIQKKLMKAAIDLLKPGGKLVYSTCTINPEENQGIVDWTLREFSDIMKLDANNPYLISGVRQFGPQDEESDSIGFFIAAFIKSMTH